MVNDVHTWDIIPHVRHYDKNTHTIVQVCAQRTVCKLIVHHIAYEGGTLDSEAYSYVEACMQFLRSVTKRLCPMKAHWAAAHTIRYA